MAPMSGSSNRAGGAYQVLRERIIFGELLPNAVLVEADIAEELGISRTPIREAFQRLAADRLIVSHRRRWYVREYNATEIEEIYQVRSCHEGFAAKLATDKLDENSRARLLSLRQQVHDDRRLHIASDWVIANDKFHSAIMDLSGNLRLRDISERSKVYYFNRNVALLYTEEDRDRSTNEHLRIVDAILAGDARAAEEFARSHVLDAVAILRRSGSQRPAKSSQTLSRSE